MCTLVLFSHAWSHSYIAKGVFSLEIVGWIVDCRLLGLIVGCNKQHLLLHYIYSKKIYFDCGLCMM